MLVLQVHIFVLMNCELATEKMFKHLLTIKSNLSYFKYIYIFMHYKRNLSIQEIFFKKNILFLIGISGVSVLWSF